MICPGIGKSDLHGRAVQQGASDHIADSTNVDGAPCCLCVSIALSQQTLLPRKCEPDDCCMNLDCCTMFRSDVAMHSSWLASLLQSAGDRLVAGVGTAIPTISQMVPQISSKYSVPASEIVQDKSAHFVLSKQLPDGETHDIACTSRPQPTPADRSIALARFILFCHVCVVAPPLLLCNGCHSSQCFARPHIACSAPGVWPVAGVPNKSFGPSPSFPSTPHPQSVGRLLAADVHEPGGKYPIGSKVFVNRGKFANTAVTKARVKKCLEMEAGKVHLHVLPPVCVLAVL